MAKALYVATCNIDGLPQGDLTPGDTVELDDEVATQLLASDSVRRLIVPASGERVEEAKLTYTGDLPENFPSRKELSEASKRTGGEVPDINTYEDLRRASDEDLLKIHGVGEKSVSQMRKAYEDEAEKRPMGDESDLSDLPE
jgi:hypothetical protein